MVTEYLRDDMVQDGDTLLQQLSKSHWPVTAAFWLYRSEAESWRLFIASPKVDANGSREAYIAIDAALRAIGSDNVEITLPDVGVIPIDHPLALALGSGRESNSRRRYSRLSRGVYNGQYIEGALVYRIASEAAA